MTHRRGGVYPRPHPAKHIKICGRGGRITVKGVRAGMNPAPTYPPDGGIDGDAVGAGFIPALTPQNIYNTWHGGK